MSNDFKGLCFILIVIAIFYALSPAKHTDDKGVWCREWYSSKWSSCEGL
ncbi:MAG TPA: hypothetical protein VF077_03885 [Nitrospiraceae bacterium]